MAESVNPVQHYNGREERCDSLQRSDQESDTEGQVGNSSQSMKGSRPKKSAFQITSVVTKKADNNHGADDVDSQDELEESRVEEASSSELLDISNLSRASQNSELDKSIVEDTVPSVSLPDRTRFPSDIVNIEETASNDGTGETNGNGPSRFRVVKVPNPEPVKRGRWTCKDFPTEKNQGQLIQERSDISKENIHSGNSSAASSVHYVPGENAPDPSGGGTGEEKVSAKRSVSRQTSSRKPSVLDQMVKTMITGDESKADDESAATAGAIDNKIEQAMDIVKGHLLMAVREEVEELKTQISELLQDNEQLRKENAILKEGTSGSSQLLQHRPSTQDSQYQSLPPNPATQMHTSSSYHQHPLPGQQQLPSSTSTGAPTEHYQQPPAHHHHPQSVESGGAQPYPHIPEAQVVDQTTYQHAIPSQPSTVTTNAEQYHPSAQGQQHQDGQYTLAQQGSQQGLPPQGAAPASSLKTPMSSSHPSQYQHPATLGMPHTSSEQGQYQTVPQHHQLGASQEHSQAVPPTGAITRPQQGSQPRIPHSQGDRHL